MRSEQAIHSRGECPSAAKELDPRGGVDEDQRRVSFKSSSNRTFPRRARSAERLARRSSSSRPSITVVVTPLPVILTAFSRRSAGTLTVIFFVLLRMRTVWSYGQGWSSCWQGSNTATTEFDRPKTTVSFAKTSPKRSRAFRRSCRKSRGLGWRSARDRVDDLLGGPVGGGVFGDVEVDDAAAMVGEHDEDEEDAQARS